MLRVKVKELSTDPEFKASLGWYCNWKRLAQRLPADMEDKVVEFHRVSSIRPEISPALGLRFESYPQYGRNAMRFELPATRTLELTGSNQSQCCPAEPTSRVSRLLWPWKRTVKNSHQKSFSKVFDNWISTHHQGYGFQYTRKAGWTKKVFFSSTMLISEKTLFEWATRLSEFKTRFERLYCCQGYHVTEHVLLSTYVARMQILFVCFSPEVV